MLFFRVNKFSDSNFRTSMFRKFSKLGVSISKDFNRNRRNIQMAFPYIDFKFHFMSNAILIVFHCFLLILVSYYVEKFLKKSVFETCKILRYIACLFEKLHWVSASACLCVCASVCLSVCLLCMCMQLYV